MLDVDHFKPINDTFGHNLGDVVLQRVAAELMDNTRSSDIPVRLGGEEFIVFAVGETAKRIGEFAERLRTRIAAIKFSAPLENWPVTISIGFAVRKPKEPLWDFIQRLDHALYEAKQSGRNQVCAALP
jgi:diguanylate cyclase (GGDEF)-like protein